MSEPAENAAPLRPVPDLSQMPASDAGGQPIGRVFGSLAEADSGLIRYVDIALDDAARHVLVPIGHVRVLDRSGAEPELRLRAAVLDDLASIPAYAPERRSLDERYERELLDAFGRVFYGDRYYAHPAFDHTRLFAGAHPIVREPSAAQAARAEVGPPEHRLVPLRERSDLRVADGEPDIIGWPLMTDADLPSGRVRDLLVDVLSLEVRYVVVDAMDGAGDLILPIGFLHLEPTEPAVLAPGLRHDDIARIERFDPAELGRASEERLRRAVEAHVFDRRRYELPDYRDGRYVDRRSSLR